MKILRYIAFLLGGIAALLVAGGLLVYATFDANKLKAEVTQIVREKKQRELSIDGDLALSFWPSIGVQAGQVRLSEHASDKPFAAVASARVSLALMPLISKQVVVDRLELEGVDATLVRGKDGKLNIDDLLSKDEKSEKNESADSGAVRFDISAIRLKGAKLAWRDEQAGQSATLSELNLATGKIANQASGRLDLAGRLEASKPAAKTDFALKGDYDIDLDKKRFALAATDVRLKGDVAPLAGLDLVLGAGRLAFETASGQLLVERLRLDAKGKLADETVELKVDAPSLQADAEKAGGETVNLVARLAGAKRTLDAKVDLAGLQGSSAALKVGKLAMTVDAKLGDTAVHGTVNTPLEANLKTLAFDMPAFALDLDAKAGDSTVKGRVSTPLAANLQAMRFDLAKIGGELDLASPQMPMKSLRLPLEGELHADLARQTANGLLATKFDDSAIRAKFGASKFAPLALNFDVDIDRLNVDKYFPPDPKKPKDAADKPIDLSGLKGLDATGAVRIGALQASGIKASNIKLEIKAANGRLDVAPHSASLYDGTLAGSLSADANGNRIVVRETLTNVNIDPLLRDVAKKDMLEGRGNVSIDVATQGASVNAMKRALGGSARVALRDGAVKGINIGKTLREYKAIAGSAKQGTAQKAASTEKTDFTEMTASFRIAGGVARNDDLAAKSPLLRLAGAGDINIGESRLDYLAKATVVNTSTGQEGKELANLKGVTVPVRLSGPFDAPSYQVDFAALATELARAKVDEAAKQLQDKAQAKVQEKVQSQVQDKLKGLFGR